MDVQPRTVSSSTTSRLLWAMSGSCLVALGLALAAQYGFDMRPCPWCVLQRAVYVLLAVALGGSALLGPGRGRALALAVSLLLAVAGGAAALYQHLVSAQQFSCSLTLADKIISALRLDSLLPSVFSATASCAEASVSVLGVPFAYWSFALYLALAAGCAGVLLKRR